MQPSLQVCRLKVGGLLFTWPEDQPRSAIGHDTHPVESCRAHIFKEHI